MDCHTGMSHVRKSRNNDRKSRDTTLQLVDYDRIGRPVSKEPGESEGSSTPLALNSAAFAQSATDKRNAPQRRCAP
jgi:hypothetical protein